jgi:L-threonylcarbamoyladenylate synthase
VIPDIVTAGGSTVGVRWPSHPFIQAVIRECGFPIAAPSANPSNELSPTNADHVLKALGDKITLIVDGGQSHVGIESTVLDLTTEPPRVLRPGMIHAESLLAVSETLDSVLNTEGTPLRSPGLLTKHYAPKARLLILSWQNEEELRKHVSPEHAVNIHVIAHTAIPSNSDWAGVSVIPHDPEAFARAIYGELHRCDEEGARLIVVEDVPTSPPWMAIADRLRRAAGGPPPST